MKSIYYIMLILGVATFALAGCGATPIKKTNCWSATGTPVATSTQGAAHVLSTSGDATLCR